MEAKLYNIIYADTPWSYNNKKTGGSMKSGAESKYPTMELSDICNLPIKQIVANGLVAWFCKSPTLLQFDN